MSTTPALSPSTPHRRVAALGSAFPPEALPSGARGRVLSAALHLFAEKGYGGTSVRDICGRAGVQPTTLYAHFPSKEHVLAEIIGIGHEAHYRRLRDALLESSPDPTAQLMTLVRTHVLSHCEFSMLAVVASAELHMLGEELSAPALAARQQSEALLASVLKRGLSLSAFDVPDPYLTLRAIGGMGQRVAFWYAPESGIAAEDVANTYAEFARRMVTPQGTTD